MSGLLSGLNTALQTMLSQQEVLEVIENNVSNSSTEGYHRQSAVLTSNPSYPSTSGAGLLGSGVKVSLIQRYNVEFYNRQYRDEAAASSRWDMQSEIISRVESTLGEAEDNSLITALDDFWASWSDLTTDPTDLSLRSTMLDSADTLADAFNGRVSDLEALQSDLNNQIEDSVSEINSIGQQIALLNSQISAVLSTNNQPNDLMDERDRLIDRLSEISGVVSTTQDNGEVMVSIDGHSLVVGHDAYSLKTTNVANLAQISWDDGKAFEPTTGELKGLMEARDVIIPGQIDGLNTLAASVMDAVNTVHTSGVDMNGDDGLNFFTYDVDEAAKSMKVNALIDAPEKVAAAVSLDDPGDGSIALQIAELRDSAIADGKTANEYYLNQVTQLGLDVQQAKTYADNHELKVDAIDTTRESISGVNLDEEASNMAKAQRIYEAASRLMTVMDEMLDTVINNMGIVGR